jgi:hypothetical protein
LGVALDVADHLRLTDLSEVVVTSGAHLAQEPSDEGEMTDDGLRGQATLCPQIGIELPKDPIVRGERRHRWRNRAFLAQYRQPSLQRGSVARLDGLLRSAMPKVLFDHSIIESGQHAAMACDPT